MARTNGPIQVWHRTDTIPTDAEGGYAGGDSTAAAIGTVGAQASQAYTFVDNIQASAVSLPPGSEATATVTGELPVKTINFGIPQGLDGRDGMGAAEAQSMLNEMSQTRSAAVSAQVAAEKAKAAAFAEPDTVVSQMVGDAETRTHHVLDETFMRRDHFSGLLPWRVAYSRRATALARIVVIGSNEGQGASTYNNRWTERLQTLLRDGSPTGSRWYSAGASATGINSQGLTVTGTTEVPGGQNGFGGRTLLMRGGSTAYTPITPMKNATIWFQRNNFFTSTGEVLVDGTKVADIPSVGDTAPAQRLTVTTTNAPHVITVRANGSPDQALELIAIQTHTADAGGVEVIEGSRQGAWLRSVASTEWDERHNPVIAELDPSLVIVYAGDQDWLDDATGFFEADVAAIPHKIDTLVEREHSALLVLPPRPVPPSGTRDPARYAYIRSMMASAAAANPTRVAFLDAGEFFPRLQDDGSTSLGMFVEATRPRTLNDAGHQWLAQTLADVLR